MRTNGFPESTCSTVFLDQNFSWICACACRGIWRESLDCLEIHAHISTSVNEKYELLHEIAMMTFMVN